MVPGSNVRVLTLFGHERMSRGGSRASPKTESLRVTAGAPGAEMPPWKQTPARQQRRGERQAVRRPVGLEGSGRHGEKQSRARDSAGRLGDGPQSLPPRISISRRQNWLQAPPTVVRGSCSDPKGMCLCPAPEGYAGAWAQEL